MKYLSSGHRGGCWTWLNAQFREQNGVWSIDTDLQVKTDAKGKKYLQGANRQLNCPIREDCYVDISFNADGLPNANASQQEYVSGKNIYFLHPRKDKVAYSVWAGLDCYVGPSYRYSGLGVLACAAGVAPKK